MTAASPLTADVQSEYAAMSDGVGLVDLSGRTQIELTGGDRTTFLHNFCTNEIKRLQPGEGCEAFVTNVQGKVLGHVFIFCRADSLVLDTVSGQAETLIPHLDRYLITEDVNLCDRTEQWGHLLLSGAQAEATLQQIVESELPTAPLAHADVTLADVDVSLRCTELTGANSWSIVGPRDDLPKVIEVLQKAGSVRCSMEAFEIARVEAAMPMYGSDIHEDTLPQEVGRNQQAISFTKGCYLGQETVARIDAMGHVNRMLVGLKFEEGKVPEAGCELSVDGKVVGRVTSAVYSPRLKVPLALAYVRRGHQNPGSKLSSLQAMAEVVSLPVE